MRRAAAGLLLVAAAAVAGETRTMVEISASLVRIRPDGGGASLRGTPSVTCPDGEEAKLFIGQNHPDGTPDPDAIRVEFTPRVRDDGRIEIKVVSLGTELGDRPDTPASTDGKTRPGGPTFHSALPAERLFSVAGKDGCRSWLRFGQKVDGWTLAGYDAATQTLSLSQGGRTLRLALAKPSLAEPAPAGPRIETLAVLPGEPAEIVGKDGHRMVIKARLYEGAPPAR